MNQLTMGRIALRKFIKKVIVKNDIFYKRSKLTVFANLKVTH